MTKHAKITLSGARDIPFSALMLSQANVRRVKAGVSIDSLASDIERRGLLQSLTVRAHRDEEGNETGRFEVPAGGRRFRALQQLVKQRRMAKTEPVPCIVRDDDAVSAEEDSLAENVHREPLHPLDQFRAMQKLVEQGSDIETVAATFMVTPAVVKQRLKLADVSPKLHGIYAEDGMTLDQLMAFSVDIEPVWGFNFSIASPTRRIVSRASSAAWGSGPAISSSSKLWCCDVRRAVSARARSVSRLRAVLTR